MTCTVPQIPLGPLRDRLAKRAHAERIPMSVAVEIIATCNFKCHHCYIAPTAERADVMSLERATELWGMLARAGTLSLLLTGGEVFSHREFREIFKAAKRAGLLVSLNSNAYLIGEKLADFLSEWPPEIISISLYGLSDERYQQVTGIPNAFRRVDRALDLLSERGIQYELKCPAMSSTVDEIAGMKAYGEARGVPFRSDPIISPEQKGDTAPLQLQLAPRKVVEVDQLFDPGFVEAREYMDSRPFTPSDDVYRCGAGKYYMAINVHGGVQTCLSSRQVVGNIFEQGFDAVWASLGGKVARQYPPGHPCATCRFRSICAGCPATVEQVSGLPEGYVQQYCQITHLRAHAMGLHPTGIPRTVAEGIPEHIRTPSLQVQRRLPVVMV